MNNRLLTKKRKDQSMKWE